MRSTARAAGIPTRPPACAGPLEYIFDEDVPVHTMFIIMKGEVQVQPLEGRAL